MVGALIGVTACQHSCKKHHHSDDDESVSSSTSSDISVVEDLYGPPIDEFDDMSSVEVVYGPPSYFDEIEGKPDIVDEPLPSEKEQSKNKK